MDELIKSMKEIRKDIDNLPLVKEYYRLKELYENDKELVKLRKEIAKLASEGKEEERRNLLHIYETHPLVSNYTSVKEEVMELLLSIKNIIE